MNRQLTCSLTETDTAETLVQELMYYGFINEVSFLFGKKLLFSGCFLMLILRSSDPDPKSIIKMID